MKNKTIDMIKTHYKGTEITSATIESYLHISGAEVRQEVQKARREGVPICSNGNGYYLAWTAGELEETLVDLRSRSMSMLVTIKALETRLQEFKGQETLNI